jgi:hypothetical protein
VSTKLTIFLGVGMTLVGAGLRVILGYNSAWFLVFVGVSLIAYVIIARNEDKPETAVSNALFATQTPTLLTLITKPIIDFDFDPEPVRADMVPDYVPKLILKITNRGQFAIQDVRFQPTEYTLKRHAAIVGVARYGNALITRRIGVGNASTPCNIFDLIPMRIEKLGHREHGVSRPVPETEMFYALRFTFVCEASQQRYSFYKVISASVPYLLGNENPFGYAWAKADEKVADALITDWAERPRDLILAHQRQMFASTPEQEYLLENRHLTGV